MFWYIFAAKTLLKKKCICFLQHNMHARAGARKIPYFIPPLKTRKMWHNVIARQVPFAVLTVWLSEYSSLWSNHIHPCGCKTGLGDQISTITQSHKLYIAQLNNAIHVWKLFALHVMTMLLSAVIVYVDQNVCENGSCFPSGNWSCRKHNNSQCSEDISK